MVIWVKPELNTKLTSYCISVTCISSLFSIHTINCNPVGLVIHILTQIYFFIIKAAVGKQEISIQTIASNAIVKIFWRIGNWIDNVIPVCPKAESRPHSHNTGSDRQLKCSGRLGHSLPRSKDVEESPRVLRCNFPNSEFLTNVLALLHAVFGSLFKLLAPS